MSTIQIALLRGINVGKAKRVAMSDLRTLVEGLGYRDVRTILNSGNVVFATPGEDASEAVRRIEAALLDKLGFSVNTVVITAGELDEIVQSNPLMDRMTDPSRMAAAIYFDPEDRRRILPRERLPWSPEAFAAGRLAAYLWCPDGFTGSPLSAALGKALGDRATSRNWATLLRIQAVCSAATRITPCISTARLKPTILP